MELKEIQDKVVKVSDKYSKVHSINRDNDWYILKLQEETGELIQNYLSFTNRGRNRNKSQKEIKQDFEDELSDVLGQILLIANNNNIDLEKTLKRKWFKYL